MPNGEQRHSRCSECQQTTGHQRCPHELGPCRAIAKLYSLSTVRQYSPVMSSVQGVTDRLLKRAADHWRGQMHAQTSRFQPFEAGEKLLEELLDFGTGEVGA